MIDISGSEWGYSLIPFRWRWTFSLKKIIRNSLLMGISKDEDGLRFQLFEDNYRFMFMCGWLIEEREDGCMNVGFEEDYSKQFVEWYLEWWRFQTEEQLINYTISWTGNQWYNLVQLQDFKLLVIIRFIPLMKSFPVNYLITQNYDNLSIIYIFSKMDDLQGRK